MHTCSRGDCVIVPDADADIDPYAPRARRSRNRIGISTFSVAASAPGVSYLLLLPFSLRIGGVLYLTPAPTLTSTHQSSADHSDTVEAEPRRVASVVPPPSGERPSDAPSISLSGKVRHSPSKARPERTSPPTNVRHRRRHGPPSPTTAGTAQPIVSTY